MTDGIYDFYLFWNEIIEEELKKGNSKRVEQIKHMIKHVQEENQI